MDPNRQPPSPCVGDLDLRYETDIINLTEYDIWELDYIRQHWKKRDMNDLSALTLILLPPVSIIFSFINKD